MTQSDYMILIGVLLMGGAYVWKEKAQSKKPLLPLPTDESN